MRKCLKCKVEKPATADFFYRDKNRFLGIMYVCKICDKKRTKLQDRVGRYSNMSDKQKKAKKTASQKYNRTDKGKSIHLANAYRKEDKKKGRDCDISANDILNVYNSNCVYCGYKATGFDRLDNSIGHIKSNCVPCCKECNVARMDNFTHEEMFLIGATIRKIKDARI